MGWGSLGAMGPASSCRPPQSAPAEAVGHQAGCALTSGPPRSAHRGHPARAGVQWRPAPGQGDQGALHLQPRECPRAPTRLRPASTVRCPWPESRGPDSNLCVWFLMALLPPGAGFIRRDSVPKAGGRHATQLRARTVGSALRRCPKPPPTPSLLPFPCMSPELPADWSLPEAWGTMSTSVLRRVRPKASAWRGSVPGAVLWGPGSAGVTQATVLAWSVRRLDAAVLKGNKVTCRSSASSKNLYSCSVPSAGLGLPRAAVRRLGQAWRFGHRVQPAAPGRSHSWAKPTRGSSPTAGAQHVRLRRGEAPTSGSDCRRRAQTT